MGRTAALILGVLLVGACSSGSDGASTTSSSVPDTSAASAAVGSTTEALTERVPLPVPATNPPPTLSDAAGLDPDELLAAAPPSGFGFVDLPDETVERLNARFRHDEVVEEVLRGVAGRGIEYGDRVTGVVLAVAVAPPVAADQEFQQSFQAQATAGAEVDSETLQIGDQEMVRFVAGDVYSVLWQQENVFILVSSSDPDDLIRSAAAVVSAVVGPVAVAGDLDGDFIPDPDADGDGIPDPTTP